MENFIRITLEKLENIENCLNLNKPIFNLKEVSEFTGISKSTLYKLTSAREIPHYKKAKHLVFDREEILLWLKSNKIDTQQEIDQESTSYITLENQESG